MGFTLPVARRHMPMSTRPLSRALRVGLIGDSITGQCMYRVTVSSITVLNGIATVTASAHNLWPGARFFIGGANERVFNGFGTVLARNSSSEFTFQISSSAPAAATGSNITLVHQQRFQDRAWFEMANASLGHPFEQVGCAGTSGATLAEISATFAAYMLPLDLDMVVIQGVINSIIGTSGGGEAAALATMYAQAESMVRAALLNGIIPIVMTCFPLDSSATGYTAARGQMVLKYNRFLRQLCQFQYPSAILFDAWSVLVDPTDATGDWRSGYTSDGIHLNALSAQRLSAELEEVLEPFVGRVTKSVGSIIDRYDADASNPQIFPNPLNTFTTGGTKTTGGGGSGANSGDVPDGVTVLWTRGGLGTVTNSIEARADGVGSDHQLVVVSTGNGDAVQIDNTTSVHGRASAGDVLVAEVHLRVTGITAMSLLSHWILFTYDGNPYTAPASIMGSGVGELSDDIDMVLRTPPLVLGSAPLTGLRSRITVTFSGAGGATIKIGRHSLTKVLVPVSP